MIKKVRKIPLGGVTVRLRNNAEIDEAFLNKIFSKSRLDNRELLLILATQDGFECARYKLRGVTLPSAVFPNSTDSWSEYDVDKNVTHFRAIDLYCRDIEAIDLLQKHEWDTVVYIPNTTTKKWKDFKAYFAFVLGHELEHVKVIREDVRFHLSVTWLYDYNFNIFKEGGANHKSKKTWNFPLELHCNKQGKELAIALFGKEQFDNCLAALMPLETKDHRKYLAFIRELKGKPYRDNICKLVRDDIRDFYDEKSKKAAYKIWKEHKSKGIEAAKQCDLEKLLPLS